MSEATKHLSAAIVLLTAQVHRVVAAIQTQTAVAVDANAKDDSDAVEAAMNEINTLSAQLGSIAEAATATAQKHLTPTPAASETDAGSKSVDDAGPTASAAPASTEAGGADSVAGLGSEDTSGTSAAPGAERGGAQGDPADTKA